MTGLVSFDEALDRAFQLAYFLQGDRMTALLVTVSAMNRLTVAAAIQNKRLYYTPIGRPALRAARTKIYLTELHLLQRLVYLESEPFERLKENHIGKLYEEDLVVHFIKYLVRATTRRNSFYVTVGLSRVLHDYSTPETKEIYGVIVQDPERVKDDFYYRSRKKQLLAELKNRFGDQVKILRGARGEERLQAQEASEALLHLVSESLSRFTPWATTCILPATFEPRKNMISSFAFSDSNPDEEHQIEISRIHTLLHPACFSRLVTSLGYDAPAQRLTIPTFFSSGDAQGPHQDRLAKTELTQEELQAIKDSLNKGAGRRRKNSGDQLLIKVDGLECGRFDPARTAQIELTIPEGADVIEVCSLDTNGEILLADHLLTYGESGIQPTQASVVLEGGQKVSFTVRPLEATSVEAADLLIIVEYRETKPLSAASLFWRRLKLKASDGALRNGWRGAGVFKPALFLLLAAIALFGLLRYLHSINNANKTPAIAKKEIPQATVSEVPSPAPQAKPSDEPTTNPVPPGPKKKPPTSVEGITADAGVTRTPRTKASVQSLLSVKQVYVDPFGVDPVSLQLRESLIRGLQSSGRFVVVQHRDEANAVLKGTARRTLTTNTETISIAVRMVSADGQVVWPAATPVSGKRYAGSVPDVTAKILNDLQGAIQQLERKQ